MRISDWSSDVCSSDLGDTVDDTLEPTAAVSWDWVARSAGCACQVRGASPAGNPALPDASTMIMMPPINPAAKMAEANGSRRREFRRDVRGGRSVGGCKTSSSCPAWTRAATTRSEEHTSELQSLIRNSYAVFCFKKQNTKHTTQQH